MKVLCYKTPLVIAFQCSGKAKEERNGKAAVSCARTA
jgi:hypothetical protein